MMVTNGIFSPKQKQLTPTLMPNPTVPSSAHLPARTNPPTKIVSLAWPLSPSIFPYRPAMTISTGIVGEVDGSPSMMLVASTAASHGARHRFSRVVASTNMFCCFCRSRATDDDDDYATTLPPAPANRKHAVPTATGASAGVHEFASQMAAADDRVAMSSVAVLHAAQIRSIRSENAGDARPVGTPPSRGGSRGATPRESQRSPGVAGDWNRSYQGQSTPGAASGAGFGSNAAAVGSGVSGSGFGGGGGVHSIYSPAQGGHHHAQYAHQGESAGAGGGASGGIGTGGGGGGAGGAGGAVTMASGPGTQRSVPMALSAAASALGRARIQAWLQESEFNYAIVDEVDNLPTKLPSSAGKGTSSAAGDSDAVTVGGGDSSGGTNSTREGSHDPFRPALSNPDEPAIEKLGSFLSSLLNGCYDDASSPAPPPQPGSSNQPFDPFASSSNAGSWRRETAVVTLPGSRKDLPPAAPPFGQNAAALGGVRGGGGAGGIAGGRAGGAAAGATRGAADIGGTGVGRLGAVVGSLAAPAAAASASAARDNGVGVAAAAPSSPLLSATAGGTATRNPSAVRTWKDSADATLLSAKFHSQARTAGPTGLGSGAALSPAAAAAAAAATAAAAAATMAGAGADARMGAAEPCARSFALAAAEARESSPSAAVAGETAAAAAAAAEALAAKGGERALDSGTRGGASAAGREEASIEAKGALGGAALADTRVAAEAATTGTGGATGTDGADGGIGGTDCTGGVVAADGAGGTDGTGGAGAAVGRGREREREGLLVQALTNQMRQNGGEGEGGDGRARGRSNGEGGLQAQEPAGREAESAGEQEWRGVSMREGRGGGESELVSRSVTEASAGDLSAVASNIGVTFENSHK
ncbi:unnamed protein product [Closterium sp. NIES-53]